MSDDDVIILLAIGAGVVYLAAKKTAQNAATNNTSDLTGDTSGSFWDWLGDLGSVSLD